MKFLKILLIIVLLSLVCVPLTYGDGSITSGDKIVYFEQEEPASLNEWFRNLSLREKIDVYTYWQGRIYSLNESDEKELVLKFLESISNQNIKSTSLLFFRFGKLDEKLEEIEFLLKGVE